MSGDVEEASDLCGTTTSPAHILINHYSLLLQELQPLEVVEVMMSHSLLTEVDHKIILDAPLDHIRNCYILEHVRHMKASTFLDILKEIPDQKHLWNTLADDTSGSKNKSLIHVTPTFQRQSNFQLTKQIVDSPQQSYKIEPNNLNVLYLYLFDELRSLLQSCKVEPMIHILTSLKASDTYDIQLFSTKCITNLSSSTNSAVLLRTLFPYSNWCDHSIIRELVGACDCPEAERILDEFDSHIDPTLPITDYPIPVYSSTMIPNKSSTHTVMAVAYNKELSSLSLQYVEVVKSIIVQKFSITKHACLLLAVADCGVTILYWLIPNSVSSVIIEKAKEYCDDLSTSGILEVAIYPGFIFPTSSGDRIWSLAYSMDKSGMFDQVQWQLQKEIAALKLKLKLRDEELKNSKEGVQILSKQVAENETATNPVPNDVELCPVKDSLLGSGSYGEVHRVYHKDGLHAGKTLHGRLLPGYSNMSNEDLVKFSKQLASECYSIAASLSHPNVEQFVAAVPDSNNGVPMIITELLTESLTTYLTDTNNSIFTDHQLVLCLDMAQGVDYLHSQSLVHRNLHGGNVLMTRDGHAKITDYLCPLLLSNVVGNSTGYVPPEVLQDKPHSSQSNVFTLGVLFLQVITRSPPKPSTDGSTWSEVVQRRSDFDSVPHVHPLISYIKLCLTDDLVARPQTKELCDLINQLIKVKDSPEMMAYKVMYTEEHPKLVPFLTSCKQQPQLHCTTCQDLPMPMFWAYAVTIGTDIYVTGGNSVGGTAINHVLKYSLLNNQWIKLPPSGFHHGVPVIVEGRLSLIGGRTPCSKTVVKHVHTYNEDSGKWESRYPDMNQPRYRPAVVVHGDYIIVLGGKVKEQSSLTNTIEIMNIKDQKWIMLTTRLPKKMYDMQATVSQDLVWIVGYDDCRIRNNKVYTIPISCIISSPNIKHSWKVCQSTVYYKMCVIPQSNPLIAFGGDTRRNKIVSTVTAYHPITNSWDEVASLSGPRVYCAVAPIGERAILVIGGCSETNSLDAANSSCCKTVEMYCLKIDSRKI